MIFLVLGAYALIIGLSIYFKCKIDHLMTSKNISAPIIIKENTEQELWKRIYGN